MGRASARLLRFGTSSCTPETKPSQLGGASPYTTSSASTVLRNGRQIGSQGAVAAGGWVACNPAGVWGHTACTARLKNDLHVRHANEKGELSSPLEMCFQHAAACVLAATAR